MTELKKFLLSPLNIDIKNKLTKILQMILKLEEAYEFLEPVDYVKYKIPDYPEIIKYPIDLGTINEKLKNNSYETIQEFLNDVQLVWDNCHMYNPHINQINQSAEHCEKKFKKEFEKIFKYNIEISENFSHDNIGVNDGIKRKDKQFN